MADTSKGARGVTRPGYQIGSRKTSPVPGMSRTKAAVNSLTAKGRAENEGRIDAVMGSGVLGGTHMGGHSDVSTAVNLGGFTVKTPVIKPSSTKNK